MRELWQVNKVIHLSLFIFGKSENIQIRLSDFLRSPFDFLLLFWEHCHLKSSLKNKAVMTIFRIPRYSGLRWRVISWFLWEKQRALRYHAVLWLLWAPLRFSKTIRKALKSIWWRNRLTSTAPSLGYWAITLQHRLLIKTCQTAKTRFGPKCRLMVAGFLLLGLLRRVLSHDERKRAVRPSSISRPIPFSLKRLAS